MNEAAGDRPDGGAITWTTSCGAQPKRKLDGGTLSLDVDPTAPLGQSQVQVTATNAKGLKSIAERNVIVWSRTLKDHLGSIAGSLNAPFASGHPR